MWCNNVVSIACLPPTHSNHQSLTSSPVSSGNDNKIEPSAGANHANSFFAESVAMGRTTSDDDIQVSTNSFQHASTSQADSTSKHPSLQLVGYLEGSSADDVFPGVGSADVGKQARSPERERDKEQFVKDWEGKWQKISAKEAD